MTTLNWCQRFRALAVATILAATPIVGCDEPTPTAPPVDPPIVVKDVIGSEGGSLLAAGGAVKLTYPASAFSSATEVSVTQLRNAAADARVVPNTVFEIKADILLPRRSGTLTIAYDPARIPGNLAESSLRLYKLTADGWSLVEDESVIATVDLAAHTVTGAARLGVYAVRSVPVDRITLYGATADGALFVGQSATIGAFFYRNTYSCVCGFLFESSPSRPIVWRSAAPTTVSVDATGKLTALAVGTATITGTVEGVTATTQITVLARPTANWTGANDWTTYQGNEKRNGYINVTVDPIAFSERWIKTPDSVVQSYNQITAGGGRAFAVIEEATGGKRQIFAMNPADGTVLWQKDLGARNQATYDDGLVYLTSSASSAFMYALNAADGSERFRIPLQSQRASMVAPLIVGPAVVVAGNGNGETALYGYDRITGRQLFLNAGLSSFSAGPWTPAAAGGLLFTTTSGVNAIDPTTGSTVQRITDLRLQANTTPVVGSTNNLLFTQALFRLTAVDLTSRRVVWDMPADNEFAPVSGNGVVYSASSGSIVARNESTGAALWSWKPTPYTVLRSMVLTNNLLFVSVSTGSDNEGLVMAIDLASHLPVWSNPFTGKLSINGDGTLYIAQRARIAAFNLR